MAHLDFEAPLVELEERIAALRALTENGAPEAEEIEAQIRSLENQADALQRGVGELGLQGDVRGLRVVVGEGEVALELPLRELRLPSAHG